MSRMLAFGLIALSVCAPAHILTVSACAQGRAANPQQTRRERPQGQPLRVDKVDANLMRVLKAWYAGTSKIKSLQGDHNRYRYDTVFKVEKRANGKFYYASPDKGRISFNPARIKPGEKSLRFSPGPPRTRYALQGDKPELWICDGSMIAEIDAAARTGNRYDIPPKAQGRNIMEGPLPFLLGMPPDMALRRYHLTLLKETETEVWLAVKPKWRQDKFRNAKVILKKDKHYLPSAVQMFDPAGSLETVYTFFNLVVDPKNILEQIGLAKGPFVVPRGIKLTQVGGKNSGNRQPQGDPRVPRRKERGPIREANAKNFPKLADFRGYKSKEVGDYLKKAGYQVVFRKGSVARNDKQLYLVEDQYPPPKSPHEVGKTVYLKVYVSANDLKPQRRSASKP